MPEKKQDADHTGHRSRMKERLRANGLDSFHTHEVLEMLLYYALPYRDTNPLGHRLEDRFGSLCGVLDADPEELETVDGVSPHTATLLYLCGQIARRYQQEQYRAGTVLISDEAIGQFILPFFAGEKSEKVILLSMDSKRKVLRHTCLFSGNVDAVYFSIRDAIQQLLRDNATLAVLAHNHPCGFALPSPEDVEVTERFVEALEPIGVRLLDHLVVSEGDYVSMAQTPEWASLFGRRG